MSLESIAIEFDLTSDELVQAVAERLQHPDGITIGAYIPGFHQGTGGWEGNTYRWEAGILQQRRAPMVHGEYKSFYEGSLLESSRWFVTQSWGHNFTKYLRESLSQNRELWLRMERNRPHGRAAITAKNIAEWRPFWQDQFDPGKFARKAAGALIKPMIPFQSWGLNTTPEDEEVINTILACFEVFGAGYNHMMERVSVHLREVGQNPEEFFAGDLHIPIPYGEALEESLREAFRKIFLPKEEAAAVDAA